MTAPATILAADWAKDFGKRAVWAADVNARTVRHVPASEGWTLAGLVTAAESQVRKPVLIAIDVVLGVPSAYFDRRGEVDGWGAASTFIDWLPGAARSKRFFGAGSDCHEWSIAYPFFAVPKGVGGRRSFAMTAGFDFLRDVDRRCRGNPVFIVSGIPGSVGSASRALWRELAPMLESDRSFRVWPFEGDLAQLLREAPTTIAEMYPRIAYAIAVAPTLPTRREAPRKKGEASVREMWVSRFRASQWLKRFSVTILDDERAVGSEDDFDSMFTAAALLRCLLENVPLAGGSVDARAEGGIVGTEAIVF